MLLTVRDDAIEYMKRLKLSETDYDKYHFVIQRKQPLNKL